MTYEELDNWQKYLIGKACPLHMGRIMKQGSYGPWCGAKDNLGRWCNGGFPPEDWLAGKEQNVARAER